MPELLLERGSDDRPGLRFDDAVWTLREVIQLSAARAALALQLRRDGPFHIGVLLDSEPEYLFWLSAAQSGAVVVGILPTRRGRDLAADVARTNCQLLDDHQRAALRDEFRRQNRGNLIDV
jgi:fatty-acyl-CoA synthase